MYKRLLELLKLNRARQPILQQCSVSSSCGSVIAWKNQLFDVVTMKNVTHSITEIYIDSFSSMVKVVIQQGLKVYTVHFTMEHAHQIGFINVKALSNYC
jgi:hypothetical protein